MALREILAAFGIEFDSKQLEQGDKLVDSMVAKLGGFGKVLAGAFTVDAIVGFFNEVREQAGAISDLSVALGTTTQELQELGYAAQLSGSDAETMFGALAKLQQGVASVAESAKGPAAEAFKKLGVEIESADGSLRSSGEIFEDIAASIAAIENPTERAGAATAIFGKQSTKLLPLLAKGKDGIAALRGEAQELGFVFSEDFVDGATEANDNIDRLKLGLRGLGIQAIAPLLPDIVALTGMIGKFVRGAVRWTKETRVVQAALSMLTGRGVLALLGAGGRLVTSLGGWGAAFTKLRGIVFRVLAPFLALEDLMVFLAGGKSVIGELLDAAFGSGAQDKIRGLLIEGAKEAWDELGAAIDRAGEFLDENAGTIGALIIAYGLYKTAVLTLTTIQAAYTGVLGAASLAKAGYAAVTNGATAALGFFRGATLAAAGATATASASMLPMLATVVVLAAAVGALIAVWDQWNKLDKETEGLGVTGVIGEMWNRGTANPFAAVDAYQNEQARKRAGLGSHHGIMVAGTDADLNGPSADAVRIPFAAPGSTASASFPNGAGATVTNHIAPNVTNHLTLPPGTSAETVRRAGEAVTRGVSQGIDLAAAEAALVPTAG